MIPLFNEQAGARLRAQANLRLAISAAAFGLAALAGIVMAMHRTDQNHTLLMSLTILLWIVSGWALIGTLSMGVAPLRQRAKLLEDALGAPRVIETGRVTGVGDTPKTFRGQLCYEVLLDCGQGERMVNWLAEALPPRLAPGAVITVESGMNLALSYGMGGEEA